MNSTAHVAGTSLKVDPEILRPSRSCGATMLTVSPCCHGIDNVRPAASGNKSRLGIFIPPELRHPSGHRGAAGRHHGANGPNKPFGYSAQPSQPPGRVGPDVAFGDGGWQWGSSPLRFWAIYSMFLRAIDDGDIGGAAVHNYHQVAAGSVMSISAPMAAIIACSTR